MPKITAAIPHSWAIDSWPTNVWPNSPQRGSYIIRKHRDALLECGALSRVGRILVILGSQYDEFLKARTTGVAGFRPNTMSSKTQEVAA